MAAAIATSASFTPSVRPHEPDHSSDGSSTSDHARTPPAAAVRTSAAEATRENRTVTAAASVGFEERWREDRAERERARNQTQALRAHRHYLGQKVSWAYAHLQREQYGAARDLLHQVAREWPADSVVAQDADQVRWYRDLRENYLERLVETTFHQGDAKALGEALLSYLTMQREEVAKRIRDGDAGWGAEDYVYPAKEYAKQIDRLLLIDGDVHIARRLATEWREMRRLCGYTDPEFDADRFRHPEMNR